MRNSTKVSSLLIFLLAGVVLLLGKHYYQNNIRYCNLEEVDEVLEMTLKKMAFKDDKKSAALYKSKNCIKTKTHLTINPEIDILKDSDYFVKVLVDGIEYDTITQSRSAVHRYLPHNFFWRKTVIRDITYELTMPAYEEFRKDTLNIRCEFIAENKLMDSIEDVLIYLDDEEEFAYKLDMVAAGPGPCEEGLFYENEILHRIDQKGWYRLEKEMTTTITQEGDMYKVVSSSPAGYLIHLDNESYKIPVPKFPDKVSYVDLSSNLEIGFYSRPGLGKFQSSYLVDDKKIGKYLTYNYETSVTSIEKIASYKDCELTVLQSNCNSFSNGVFVTFNDYPSDKNNTYVSL